MQQRWPHWMPNGVSCSSQLCCARLLELYAGADTRYLNYYGPPRTVTTVPYVQALAWDQR